MPLKAAPVWALLGPGRKDYPESWGVRTDVTNLATSGVTKMYLYGEIGPWGVSADDVLRVLSEVTGPVEVHINSMGGSVFEGLAIYQAFREHPHAVNVVVDGLAASAASFIAMAGTTIEVGSAAHIMIHEASALCMGTAADMEASAVMLRGCTTAIAGLYAKRTGKPTETFLEAMAAETWYVGQEAVDAGLADKVRGEDGDEPEFPGNVTFTGVEAALTIKLDALADPPVMSSPDSREEEEKRERPVETDGNTPKGCTEPDCDTDPPDDEIEHESDLTWDHLEDTATFAWLDDQQADGLFDHLMEGAAQ